MFYDLGVWLAGLVVVGPAIVLGLACVNDGPYYRNNPTKHWRKVFYRVALIAGCASTLASFAYWGWRVCGLYQITLPFILLVTLERSIYACRLFSALAIVGLIIGRGPYRVLLTISILWVMVQLWTHGHIIHWA
jgi:hypothetical protein